VRELVGQLDLSAFAAAYRATGGASPYDPKVMLALIVYLLRQGYL